MEGLHSLGRGLSAPSLWEIAYFCLLLKGRINPLVVMCFHAVSGERLWKKNLSRYRTNHVS